MKSISDLNLNDKIVLVRADFNVPLDSDLNITNNKRIREFIPTLKFIQEKGGKPVLMSHLGRPDGKPSAKFSLKSIIPELEKLSNSQVIFAEDCISEGNRDLASNLKSGQLLLL
ncbi:MAG: phosphoglycerate kinase, partial [Candidatus Paceibacterota bacterium]